MAWASGALLASASGVFSCKGLVSWWRAWGPHKTACLGRLPQAAHKLGDSFSFILWAPMTLHCSFPAVAGVPQAAALQGAFSIPLRVSCKVLNTLNVLQVGMAWLAPHPQTPTTWGVKHCLNVFNYRPHSCTDLAPAELCLFPFSSTEFRAALCSSSSPLHGFHHSRDKNLSLLLLPSYRKCLKVDKNSPLPECEMG